MADPAFAINCHCGTPNLKQPWNTVQPVFRFSNSPFGFSSRVAEEDYISGISPKIWIWPVINPRAGWLGWAPLGHFAVTKCAIFAYPIYRKEAYNSTKL